MMRARKAAFGGFAAVAVFLVVTGVAYACVPFKGTAQVTSSSAGSQSSTATTGDGSSQNMSFCGNGTRTTPGYTTATEAQNKGGDVITVTVGSATCDIDPGVNSQLGNRNHTVIINNATTTADAPFSLSGANTWSIIAGKGCFTSPNPAGNKTLDTAFSVTSAGTGTKTYTLPTMNSVDGSSRISALCVGHPTDATASEGIFVPIKITAT